MNKLPVAVFAGIALAVTVAPVTVSAEPLRDELNLLLAEHPDLRRARNDAAAAESRIGEAKAANLPRLELTGDTGAERTDSPDRRTSDLGAFSIRRDKLTLTMTQNLFNGFRDQAGINAAEIGLLEQKKGIEDTRQELLFEGIKQYLDTLRFVRLIKVAQATEKILREIGALENERVKKGAGTSLDKLEAKSRLQVAKEVRVSFEGRLQEALASYKQLFGHLPDIATLEEGQPPKDLVPDSLDTAIRTALQYHPALQKIQYQADIAREQKRIAKADFLPSVDLVGSLDYQDNVGTTRGIEREQSFLVKARWEFFSGFKTRSRVESAARTLASRRDSLNFAARRAEEDVRIAWDRLLTERRRVELLKNAITIAEEVYDGKKRLRKLGKETVKGILDARQLVFLQQIKLINVDFDSRIAAYLLARRTGMLTPAALQLSDLGTNSVARVPWVESTKPNQLRISKTAMLKPSVPVAPKRMPPVLVPSVASVSPSPKPAVQTPVIIPLRAVNPPSGSQTVPMIGGADKSVTLRSPNFSNNDATNPRNKVTVKSEPDPSAAPQNVLATVESDAPRVLKAVTQKPSVLPKRIQLLPATPVAIALPPRS